ncbi:Os01g0897900 [Oryza sativa Japonica Group]|uniref:Os01g0897900 protein n=1 Tax=Oryza sativa subsp. japonica TaxID=39947 RepID=A0A0P0VBP5_ORYSJ|nr:Os01g0897900 [Oryza sativa Japonica Group]
MAVAMMHYFFFRRHRRDDDGGGEQDMLLRESFLRRMEEGAAAAAAGDQRRSPPTLTPTPRRCYSREAGYRSVRGFGVMGSLVLLSFGIIGLTMNAKKPLSVSKLLPLAFKACSEE